MGRITVYICVMKEHWWNDNSPSLSSTCDKWRENFDLLLTTPHWNETTRVDVLAESSIALLSLSSTGRIWLLATIILLLRHPTQAWRTQWERREKLESRRRGRRKTDSPSALTGLLDEHHLEFRSTCSSSSVKIPSHPGFFLTSGRVWATRRVLFKMFRLSLKKLLYL